MGSIVGLLGNMSVENHGGMILQSKTEELAGNPVPVLLCPPQVPHGLTRERTGLLSHGTQNTIVTLFFLRYVDLPFSV
jgi:hypothetical protein